MSRTNIRFPNETAEYRAARDKLLEAEIRLRSQVEEVARLRRALPEGGPVAQDYTFDELTSAGTKRSVRLSELFTRPDASLAVYSFMYGPKMEAPCPMCTSLLDGLNGSAPHIHQRLNFVVVARSPIERVMEHARQRGWNNLRMLSSSGSTYNADYFAEDSKSGEQWPMLNVFKKGKGGEIRHRYGTESLFAKFDDGFDARHVDLLWPVWNMLDLTPEGRGEWYPALKY